MLVKTCTRLFVTTLFLAIFSAGQTLHGDVIDFEDISLLEGTSISTQFGGIDFGDTVEIVKPGGVPLHGWTGGPQGNDTVMPADRPILGNQSITDPSNFGSMPFQPSVMSMTFLDPYVTSFWFDFVDFDVSSTGFYETMTMVFRDQDGNAVANRSFSTEDLEMGQIPSFVTYKSFGDSSVFGNASILTLKFDATDFAQITSFHEVRMLVTSANMSAGFGIDNIGFVPEPTSAVLAGIVAALSLGRRRRD